MSRCLWFPSSRSQLMLFKAKWPALNLNTVFLWRHQQHFPQAGRTLLNCTGTSRGTGEWCVPSIIYQTLEVQWFSSYSSARSGLTCLHGLCDWQWCNGHTEQYVCHVSRLYLATIIVLQPGFYSMWRFFFWKSSSLLYFRNSRKPHC